MPLVKCSFCGKDTATGLHQVKLEVVEKAVIKVINGKQMIKPARMKQTDLYMCTDCVAKDVKWPGRRP